MIDRDRFFRPVRVRAFQLVGAVMVAVSATISAQTWTPLANKPKIGTTEVGIQMMMLLPDGTVMAQQTPGSGTSSAWFRLTPDIHGSYVNGTWTQLASMNQQRLFYSSVVLQNGKVFVAGGEYGTGGTQASGTQYLASAEIFDPVANIWTPLPAVPSNWQFNPTTAFSFGDSASTLLPNGNVLLLPVFGLGGSSSTIYNVATNSWSNGPAPYNLANLNEASCIKLPDDSVLTIPSNSTASQRYIPGLGTNGQWIADATTPAIYSAVGGEIGSAQLLPNGDVMFIGANGNTALYTPTGNNNPGTWRPGASLPNVPQNNIDNNGVVTGTSPVPGAAPDGPSAMLPNGKILCALTGTLYNDPRAGTGPAGSYWLGKKNPQYPTPVSFFEYDPVANSFSPPINGPTGATDNIMDFQAIMLVLPNGSILYSNYGSQLYTYTSPGAPVAAGKPVITSITNKADGSYHLAGTGLNGISFGASYGEDAQMDSNYPIVRMTSTLGDVSYARTFSWSNTGVRTGSLSVSTEFSLTGFPSAGGGGSYSLVVVANGISSDPISFSGRVWVDFSYTGTPERGTFSNPYNTFYEGLSAISPGGTLVLKGGHSSSERITNLSGRVTIISVGGSTTIGR